MMPLDRLGPLLALDLVGDPFADRDAIKARIAGRLVQRTTDDWMAALRAHDIWCAPVLDWPALLASDAFARLGMLQRTDVVTTTRPPLRIDGTRAGRSEEHTSELQSLMRISYAVFCLTQKTTTHSTYRAHNPPHTTQHPQHAQNK